MDELSNLELFFLILLLLGLSLVPGGDLNLDDPDE